MIIEKDDEKSSGTAVPEKSYAGYFNGANIQTLILGDGVFERVGKLPEEVLHPNRERTAPKTETMKNEFIIAREKIGRCILAVQKYFWGSSCYAILYCVLRDRFGYDKKMKCLENDIRALSKEMHFDYVCPNNTISNTFYHNKFMRYHIDKWEGRQANSRATDLVDNVFDAITKM
jgi:hypothetical protein